MHPPVRIVGRSPVLGVSPALLPAFLEDLAPLCLTPVASARRGTEVWGGFALFALTLEHLAMLVPSQIFSASPGYPQGEHVAGRWLAPEEPGITPQAMSMLFPYVRHSRPLG